MGQLEARKLLLVFNKMIAKPDVLLVQLSDLIGNMFQQMFLLLIFAALVIVFSSCIL